MSWSAAVVHRYVTMWYMYLRERDGGGNTHTLAGLLKFLQYEFLAILSESMATDRYDARVVAESLPHPEFGKRQRGRLDMPWAFQT